MASSIVVTISGNKAKGVVDNQLNSDKKSLKALCNYISGLASGAQIGSVSVQTASSAAAAASGTFTLVSAIATDTVTIGGVIFTATSTPTTELHWEIDGASDTLDAASLSAAINAHSTIGQIVVATSASGVVTLTARQKGVVGNFIPISSQDATITASGAFLTGGTGGAQSTAKSY